MHALHPFLTYFNRFSEKITKIDISDRSSWLRLKRYMAVGHRLSFFHPPLSPRYLYAKINYSLSLFTRSTWLRARRPRPSRLFFFFLAPHSFAQTISIVSTRHFVLFSASPKARSFCAIYIAFFTHRHFAEREFFFARLYTSIKSPTRESAVMPELYCSPEENALAWDTCSAGLIRNWKNALALFVHCFGRELRDKKRISRATI